MMTHSLFPRLKAFAKAFIADEDGAVTVDWVVLTAGVIALTLVVTSTVGGGLQIQADSLSAGLAQLTSLLPWN